MGSKTLLIFLLFFFTATPAFATNYYVSNTGNDAASGTSESAPWKTIAKVNTILFLPGDQILFKKGDAWKEQLTIPSSGNSSNSIIFGAYGNGSNPVIDGTTPVTGWSVYSGSIYVADVTSQVTNVFVDNNYYTPAHYPNSGYSIITSNSGDKVSLVSTGFNPPNSDLAGAGISIRSVPWRIEKKTVSTYDPVTHKISWTENTEFAINTNYGFYLTNKLWMLDQAGEWYWDSVAGKLYLWLSDSSNPNNHSITVSRPSSIGIKASNKNYFTIQDINIQNTDSDGVQLNTCTNVTLQRLSLSYAGRNGIYANGSSSNNLLINDNVIDKALITGIQLSGLSGSKSTISNNVVSNTGNYGLPITSSAGINISASKNLLVFRNTVSNNNYIGIRFSGTNNVIQNNIVRNSCLILDDCSSIYTWGNLGTGNQVLGNLVTDSIGNYTGTVNAASKATQAHGIYLDNDSNNVTVSGNTVSNTDMGIYIHDSYSNTVTGNIVYQARKNGLLVQEDPAVALGTVKNNTITENIFLNNSTAKASALFQGILGNVAFGTYNFNTYFSSYVGYPVSQRVVNTMTNYSLADWRTASGQDAQSSDIGSFFKVSLGNNHKTSDDSVLYTNGTAADSTVDLGIQQYCDITNNIVSGSFVLAPFSSKILLNCFNNNDGVCNNRETHTSAPLDCPGTDTPTPSPTPAGKPGDANGDNKVDGVDYVVWLNHYNQTVTGGASVGDFNTSGIVDGVDYVVWLNNYGK